MASSSKEQNKAKGESSAASSSQGKKETKLGISATKFGDFHSWYGEVITKSELIDYYEVSGCYILRPYAYKIWEGITKFFDGEIKKLGVEPCYFPMFVTKRALEKEKEHVEDFSPEVAWVTKYGDSDLKEPIAIRPTSETIMYPAFARWIRSHRDLPLRLNQWTNVVRWEFKNPTPFLRTREFLWQEGHSAFATREEADEEVLQILDLYARVYEELMAIPVIKGRKSDKEKFAGGDFTTTVEAFIPCAGRAIQGATSHSLGQNFSKMFEITFQDDAEANSSSDGANAAASSSGNEGVKYAWQNSWGLTTRTLGVMVMVHGDDKGLVIPPRLAPIQIIIIPIYSAKDSEEVAKGVFAKCNELCKLLKDVAGILAEVDSRSDRTAGFKYAHWEQRGVPIRLEMGPRDLKENSCMIVRRVDGQKETLSLASQSEVVDKLKQSLDDIHQLMLAKARRERDERLSIAWDWDSFLTELNKGNMVLVPWCMTTESEEWVKKQTKDSIKVDPNLSEEEAAKVLSGSAKTLCIPFNQPPLPEGTLCFTGNGKPASEWVLFGRSY